MHVEARPLSGYPWWLRPFFWSQQRRYGAVLDPALLWARRPKLFAAVALLYGALDRPSSPVPPPLRALLTVRVSQINHCRFCIDINAATLLKRGVSEEKVLALSAWRTSPLFDARERVALDYAERITETGSVVDAELIARLKRYFDDDGLVELTGLIAFQNLASKFNAALDVPPQGFCALPVSAAEPAPEHAVGPG